MALTFIGTVYVTSEPQNSTVDRWVPWAGIVALLALLLVSRHRYNALTENVTAYKSSVDSVISRMRSSADSMIHTGDTLPDIALIDSRGTPSNMADLPSLNFEYIYLSRSDCEACIALRQTWQRLNSSALSEIAFIEYNRTTDTSPDSDMDGHFGIIHEGRIRSYPLTRVVPAVLAVRSDGRVVSVAEGYYQVIRLLQLNKLLATAVADSILAAPTPSTLRLE